MVRVQIEMNGGEYQHEVRFRVDERTTAWQLLVSVYMCLEASDKTAVLSIPSCIAIISVCIPLCSGCVGTHSFGRLTCLRDISNESMEEIARSWRAANTPRLFNHGRHCE